MMRMSYLAYQSLAYVHLLLFALWLGADAGVFLLGQHFRKRHAYSLDQRVALLKLLVIVDMVPRTAWALMVPISLTLASAGGMLVAPVWLVPGAWALGGVWLWLVWDAHLHDQTPRAARDRRIEFWLKVAILIFYLGIGVASLATGAPIALPWLAWKAVLFAAIFAAAIMIDVRFRPVGPQLVRLLNEGSSDATEIPLRATMDRTRRWVFTVYALLIATSWLGVAKP
jgi:hypothetical protein